MTESPPIVAFLTARYDEEQELAEAAAESARPGYGDFNGADWEASEHGDGVHTGGAPVAVGAFGHLDVPIAEHTAAHDPAHVLIDLTVKRYLVSEYALAAAFDAGAATESALNAGSDEAVMLRLVEAGANEAAKNVLLGVVKDLASAYVLHPEYDPAWSLWPAVRALAGDG